MSFTLVSGAARAGDGPPEAVIGTFETTRDARAAAGKPATFDFEAESAGPQSAGPQSAGPQSAGPKSAGPNSPGPKSSAPKSAKDEPGKLRGAADHSADDEVSRAYADGMDALENGETAVAQRKLELVVARDPDGHLAKSARSYLADLYRGDAAPARRAAAVLPQAPPSPKFATSPSALGAGDIARRSDIQAPTPPQAATPPQVKAGLPVAANVEEDFIVTAGDRVFFGAGSAELGQRARIVLAAQARWLSSHIEYVAVIEGHADDGAMPDEQSAKLSEFRATAVRERLIEEGVPAARLTLLGQGRKEPVANCPGSDCAAQNRRVVTVLKVQGRDIGLRARGPALASDGGPQPTQ